MNNTSPRHGPLKLLLAVATSVAASNTGAEVLDSLHEWGNAATANETSAIGNERGFTNPAADEYTITAGGTDIWGNTDHGSGIFDADLSRAAGEDFSAIVRSVSIAADPFEGLAGEWGRTGLMARVDPAAANSANVAHIRKTGTSGNAGTTLLQARDTNGGGTDRNSGGVTDAGYHGNAAASNANGSVRNTPIWLGLHRFNGTWYSTWAPDDAGAPGTWSSANARPGTAATQGEVYVGLVHQSHNIHPVVNTAVFDNFSVGAFDVDLGDFPPVYDYEVTFSGEDIFLTASGNELGISPTSQDVDWEVRLLGPDVDMAAALRADIYLGPNDDAARNGIINNTLGVPAGTAFIPNISWSNIDGIKYPDELVDVNNTLGTRNLFNEAVPARAWTGDESDYGVHLTGEIHIPNDADRDGVEMIRFHDGNDDFTYLQIDGVVLINDNTWTSWSGVDNSGGAQATLDVSDPKYDDGEWVSIRFGMWEGGGGDHANLTWDALDVTGADSVTGGIDTTLGTYNPTNLADGAQVNFTNDASDQVPSLNFRTTAPGLTTESGSGQPSNQQLGITLSPTDTALQLILDGQLVATISTVPFLSSANFTDFEEATLVVSDVPGARVVDDLSIAVTRDGVSIAPTITKDGDLTTIVDSFAPELFTNYEYEITGMTTVETGSVPFSFTTTIRSFPLPEVLRAGLPDPPNATTGWDYWEFDVVATLGGGLGGGEQMFRDAITVIQTGTPDQMAQQPYINHTDPDTNPNSGDWLDDLPILRNTAGDDNQYVTLARTVITIGAGEEGNYTFRIRGDDGYALRIEGATFTQVTGNAVNRIHPVETSTVFFPDGTGDSNAFAVSNFPAPGDYLVEFLAFEGGGGSYQEVGWAPGVFTATNQTSAWALVGDMSGYNFGISPFGVLPDTAIPALPEDPEAGWSTYFYYNASVGSATATMNFLRTADPGTATAAVEPVMNHSDDNTGDQQQFGGDRPYPGDPVVGGDTDNIAVIAHARIVAPVEGDYTIQVRSDDGFVMRWVDPDTQWHSKSGAGTLHPNNLNEVYFPAGTGDSNTRASVFLTAGTHDVIFVWWEGGGGSHFEISSAPGVVPNHGPAYELVSTTMSDTHLWVSGVTTQQPDDIFLADVGYDPNTEELQVFVDNVPATGTFHLRASADGETFDQFGVDFDSSTAMPIAVPLSTAGLPAGTGLLQIWTGPSIP